MDLNVKIRTGNRVTEEIDSIPNNEQKEKMQDFFDFYISRISNIATTIETLKIIYDNEHDFLELGNFAPAFFNTLTYNFKAQAIVQLYAYYAKKNELSFYSFFKYVIDNFDLIFTIDYCDRTYWNDNIVDEVHTKFTKEELVKTRRECKKLIKEKQPILNRFKDIRDKIIAHFTEEEIEDDVTNNELEEIFQLTETIINKIQHYYNRCYTYCKPTNADDFNNILYAVKKYNKYARFIHQKEVEEIITNEK